MFLLLVNTKIILVAEFFVTMLTFDFFLKLFLKLYFSIPVLS